MKNKAYSATLVPLSALLLVCGCPTVPLCDPGYVVAEGGVCCPETHPILGADGMCWAEQEPPPRRDDDGIPIVTVRTVIVADDGQFLGVVNSNRFDPESIANRFGTYGSRFDSLSIWNRFGDYGSQFSRLSAWNDFTTTPPRVLEDGVFVEYLTTNRWLLPRIDPNDLALLVGRDEQIRP